MPSREQLVGGAEACALYPRRKSVGLNGRLRQWRLSSNQMNVVAIVVTYRRHEVLAETLRAVAQQSKEPVAIVVVDNDAPSGDMVRPIVESIGGRYVAAPDNIGFGAALALGIRCAHDSFTPDAYWLLDDDSIPAPTSLALLVAELAEGVGLVANRGGRVRCGRIRHTFGHLPAGERRIADFTLVDGALLSASAVQKVGTPREDLFMMLEDFEFSTRVKAAGFELLVAGGDESEHRHLGSNAPWRHYYQARNLLRIAVDRRSPSLLLGWAVREAATLFALMRSRQFKKLGLRARGARDAVLGRMGHVPGLP